MIINKFPGKLFIVGEYFIMEPDQVAVVAAVNKYLTVRVSKHQGFQLISDYGTMIDLKEPKNPRLKLAYLASQTAYEYLNYLKITPDYNIEITLDSDLLYEGKKIGLGSSGVVVVAVIWAILNYHQLETSPLELFKLATLVQLKEGNMSSGGDIAAAAFKNTIIYKRYDLSWLLQQDYSYDLVSKPWPDLVIEPFKHELPNMIVAWSKKENITSHYLQEFKLFKKKNEAQFKQLKVKANHIGKAFAQDGNLSMLESYRLLMLELEMYLGIEIETESLREFIEESYQKGQIAKVSGSGGGDCAIAFGDDTKYKQKSIKILNIGRV
ncbi:MAG TPA: phosphomevalonate kinase [Erysipelothrix sp.]